MYSLGAGLMAAGYTMTFVYGGLDLPAAAASALCNVGAAYLLGIAACGLSAQLMRAPWPLQLSTHALAAGLYSWAWYGLMRTAYAAADWVTTGTFEITGFPPGVLTWQICQGLLAYGLLACATYAFVFASGASKGVSNGPERPADLLRRFLTRRGDFIEPVDVDEIISISGADDYSEVVTRRGRHLVRLSLGEFERRLAPDRFLRVHRSRIINFDRLLSAEPAGSGRLLLHLEGGEAVQVSRAGAQRLRERIV